MAKIYAPNAQYTGISAGVPFAAGVAETDDPARIRWFMAHGYRVEVPEPENPNPKNPARKRNA